MRLPAGLPAMLDPAIAPAYASSAMRILRRGVTGQRRHSGDAPSIIRAVIEDCWTGDHFTASAGQFRQFWTRDLGFSAEPLVRLGHRDRVEASLAWALDGWARRGRVTTTIFPGRRPRDVYTLGVDSLPLAIHTLRAAGADGLVGRHAGWLAREVARYAAEVVDPRTGLARADRRFSTHRDTVRTASNCYANAMVALLDAALRQTGWFRSPFAAGVHDRFIEAFWRGDRFVDHPDGPTVTGDAIVVPFWLGVTAPELGLREALAAAEAAGLTTPLPLRYAARRDREAEDPVQRLFVPDYQGTSIWTSLGAMYVALLDSVDPERAGPLVDRYVELVERDGTFWEVYDGRDPRLIPYRGRLGIFRADEAMLWSSILLDLLECRRSRHQTPIHSSDADLSELR